MGFTLEQANKKPYFHSKFEALWNGLYQIEKIFGHNSYLLKDATRKVHTLPVNGKFLKHFFI
jgi:hypothetical protein